MLSSPELPRRARETLFTYVEEKMAGLYGHNKIQLRRFAHSASAFWFARQMTVIRLALYQDANSNPHRRTENDK
jgi:hypothetical protein